MGLFSRKRDQPVDPQQMIDRMHESQAAMAAEPGAAALDPDAPADGADVEVEDVFTITGRGTVAVGRVAAGEIRVGQDLTIDRGGAALRRVRVQGIEAHRKMIGAAGAGEQVGVLLRGVGRNDVQRGDRLRG